MKILALDAATEWCSAALCDGSELFEQEFMAERGHGEQLLTMVDALLAQAGLVLGGLDAVAFGRGPGAFTGLRLAASLTQGLAYSAGLPVIPVSDLRALAQQVLGGAADGALALACQDARMGEVYWAGFKAVDRHAAAIPATEECVARPEDMLVAAQAWLDAASADPATFTAAVVPVAGVGNGFAIHAALAPLAVRLAPVLAEARPRAREIALLAAHDGIGSAVPPERAWPVYVRNNVAVPSAARSN